MKTTDIQALAVLLQKATTDVAVQDLLQQYEAHVDISPSDGYAHIDCHKHGFDVLLSPEPGIENCRVDSLRFFSPTYCVGKDIVPYTGALVGGLTFPLSKEKVRATLGIPARSSDDVRRFDEYDYPQCSVRFVYPARRDEVAFVSLLAVPQSRPAIGLGATITPQMRLRELSGLRKDNWQHRLKIYENTFGPPERVIRGDNPNIDIIVFGESPDRLMLITNGMSDRPMNIGASSEDYRRAELQTYVTAAYAGAAAHRLYRAAAFPFVENTYIGHGDTIKWMDPIIQGSELTEDLILYCTVKEHRNLTFSIEGDAVRIFWCVPITEEELDLKRRGGIQTLLDLFDKMHHPLVLDPYRKSYA